MQIQPLLSATEIERLVSQQTISNQYPWSTDDEHLIDTHIKEACDAVTRQLNCESKVESYNYGSGYASFIDAWFYKAIPEFNAKRPIRYGEEHTGLVVLFSRFSPYFVLMEGEKSWHAHGGASYLPEFSMLDRFETPAVFRLAEQVQLVLESRGFIRILREQLEQPLQAEVCVPTILHDSGFNQFDALFYWQD